MIPFLRGWLLAAMMLAAAPAFAVPAEPGADFMLVLREVVDGDKTDFGYAPMAPFKTTFDGEEVSIDNAWYALIGDMMVRFVIDGDMTMRNLTAEEFAEYGVSPEDAAALAIANIRARYGEPDAKPLVDGIMVVAGESPDVDSSYFLDRAFWDGVLVQHPEGVVVGVPQRGGLVYAPVADTAAVASLEERIRGWYAEGGSHRVSAKLYLYHDGRWSRHSPAASVP